MKIIHSLTEFHHERRPWRERVALVPTMGNLHDGHLSLVRQAKKTADKVVVTIFVNPLQFAPHEDFSSYPRTLAADIDKLSELNIDILFAPSETEIYPRGKTEQTQVFVPEISKILCGVSRPHFFQGVATVVAKLFNIVKPDVAVFGEKDYQQLCVIRRMVEDLNMDIEILGMPTVRETDGLAMSSRNQYLSASERQNAAILYAQLSNTAAKLRNGERNFSALCDEAKAHLNGRGFQTDYYEIRDTDLSAARAENQHYIILAAAWLGKTRLIDNLKT